jgi:uncharacterized protein YjbJ (UPF0337 family)
MKISSFWKQAIRTVQFSLAALVCSVALNFATAAPTLAAQVQVPTPHLAIFGWGEKEKLSGKVEQLVGKAKAKTGNKLEGTAKQISGRAKYDLDRVEDAAERNANKTGKMAKDIQKSTEKNLNKAQNAANDLVDNVKKNIAQ